VELEPCATPLLSKFPPLFYCVFGGIGGELANGPLHARILEERQSSDTDPVGMAVIIECPLPSFVDFQRIAADDGSVGVYTLNLTIAHLTPEVRLPFSGKPHRSDALAFASLPLRHEPPPTSPPSPPSLPPVLPPEPPPPPTPPPPLLTPISNAVTAAMISSPSAWSHAGVCCNSIGQALTRPLSTTNDGFSIHSGHTTDSSSQWPLYIVVDLRSQYPSGLALNELQWSVHVNGFGTYQVQGRNGAGSNWVTISTQNMNGVGSGISDGTIHTDSWSNDVRYTWYRIAITDCNNAGGRCGYASYAWQWNRI